MALVPFRGGGGGGGLRGGGGGSNGCLHTLIEGVIVVVVLGTLIQGGALENLAHGLLSLANHVVVSVRLVVGGLAVMAMMAGGILAISPFHRRLGYEVALGGLIAIALAAVGPTVVADVQKALPQAPIPQSAVVGEEVARW
jgi:hypothetical protein